MLHFKSKHATAPMPTEYATAADFTNWEAMAKAMTTCSLKYTIADCSQAAAAMRGWNPIREGFYMDQLATYHQELDRRQGRA